MIEYYESQKKRSGNFRKLLKERMESTNPRRELTTDETKRLAKLEAIADILKCGKNVKNRQLQTWLNEDEYAVVDAEWQEQTDFTPIRPQPPLPNQQVERDKR